MVWDPPYGRKGWHMCLSEVRGSGYGQCSRIMPCMDLLKDESHCQAVTDTAGCVCGPHHHARLLWEHFPQQKLLVPPEELIKHFFPIKIFKLHHSDGSWYRGVNGRYREVWPPHSRVKESDSSREKRVSLKSSTDLKVHLSRRLSL